MPSQNDVVTLRKSLLCLKAAEIYYPVKLQSKSLLTRQDQCRRSARMRDGADRIESVEFTTTSRCCSVIVHHAADTSRSRALLVPSDTSHCTLAPFQPTHNSTSLARTISFRRRGVAREIETMSGYVANV
uniref:Uncharacterized protein n=1 Tax=Setaria digitata TaxID=48799 RepID=A0A915Q4R6_9BILA